MQLDFAKRRMTVIKKTEFVLTINGIKLALLFQTTRYCKILFSYIKKKPKHNSLPIS